MRTRLIVLFCVLATAGNALAGNVLWQGGQLNGRLWDTAASWENGTIPTTADAAFIVPNGSGPSNANYPIIETGIAAEAAVVALGFAGFGNARVDLDVTGGSLAVGGDFSIGNGGPLANHGVLNVSGDGAVSAGVLGVGWNGGTGTLNISDSGTVVANTLFLPAIGSGFGNINLFGGTLTASAFGWTDALYHVEIQAGTMVVDNVGTDLGPLIHGSWAAWWTGYGSNANVVVDFANGINTITAVIPEPSSIVLLGLGSLVMLGRRRM